MSRRRQHLREVRFFDLFDQQSENIIKAAQLLREQFYNFADARAKAHAIKEVMSAERYKVGAWRAGRALADRLSPEKVAERFEGLYEKHRGSRTSTMAARS